MKSLGNSKDCKNAISNASNVTGKPPSVSFLNTHHFPPTYLHFASIYYSQRPKQSTTKLKSEHQPQRLSPLHTPSHYRCRPRHPNYQAGNGKSSSPADISSHYNCNSSDTNTQLIQESRRLWLSSHKLWLLHGLPKLRHFNNKIFQQSHLRFNFLKLGKNNWGYFRTMLSWQFSFFSAGASLDWTECVVTGFCCPDNLFLFCLSVSGTCCIHPLEQQFIRNVRLLQIKLKILPDIVILQAS